MEEFNNKPARVRFAPSPTGILHLGSARTALIDYLLARKTGGQFILRIEDTDQKRFVPGAEEEFKTGLRWLGIEWDEGPDIGGPFGPYRQSERKVIYQRYAKKLVNTGHAYYCFCTPERLHKMRQERIKRKENPQYDGLCRLLTPEESANRVLNEESHVIRFKTPKDGSTTVKDCSRGEITVKNRTIDDYILIKSDGLAVYHLAAMVDDHLMKITHVIRGSEWLPTFPLHALILRAFGWDEPIWVHLSVFLKPSGKGKMSKRDVVDLKKGDRSIFIKDMEGLGYLPEAVVNWTALMGWSYDDHQEFFTKQELIEKFNLEKLNPSPAAINFSKLDHFNRLHIRNLPRDEIMERLVPYYQTSGIQVDKEILHKMIPIIQERLVNLDDAPRISGFFFMDEVKPNPDDLIAKKLTARESAEVVMRSVEVLSALPDLTHEIAETEMRQLVEELGLKAGQVFGILRVAVTGQKVSPPLFESMEIIGKVKVLERLKLAIDVLNELAMDEENQNSSSE
jgi:glutamyl-tRNA synthetase